MYILTNKSGKLYIGCTRNLKERLEKHNKGYVFATKSGIPWRIKTFIAVDNEYTAFYLEKYLKTGSGRAFLSKHILK
ncbi:GIY-YIG nuclease family protein [Patescibacteria group bacterium]|nr:GIY-YIG nuclease family protein [Patescibacteria group bacterium]